jgi:RimJ/RimL family protein N-acetyltransferase
VDEETERTWIEQVLAQTDSMRYAICDATTDEYIGNVQITHIKDGSGEFHIFIGNKDYWGKGVGSQATMLMLQEAFAAGLLMIYLYVHPQNKPAIAIYERCGFVTTYADDSSIRMEINRSKFR